MRLVNLMLVISFTFTLSCSEKVKNEDLEWKSMFVELGDFDYGGKQQVKFEFKNLTNHSISIKQIIPGCDCTIIDGYTDNEITEGQSGEINISYDTKKGIIGPFQKELFVFFEGTTDDAVTLLYSGTVTGNK
jgi:hypothetical protein